MLTVPIDNAQKKERTELVLKRVTTLSPMPKILNEVLDLLKDVNTSPQALAKAISKDQNIVIKILTIANSPFYGFAKRISSIDYAVMLLGFNEIRNIIMAMSVMEAMKNKSDQFMDQKNFWMHSYITGTIAKKLATDMGYKQQSGEAFVAGLLHDMGISVIHRYFHSDFASILENVKNGMRCLDAENLLLGMDHQNICYTLLKNWNIPDSLCQSVKFHHSPMANEGTKEISALVHFADYTTQRLKVGEFSWDDDLELDAGAMKVLNFNSLEEAHNFIDSFREQLNTQIESLRLLN